MARIDNLNAHTKKTHGGISWQVAESVMRVNAALPPLLHAADLQHHAADLQHHDADLLHHAPELQHHATDLQHHAAFQVTDNTEEEEDASCLELKAVVADCFKVWRWYENAYD